MASGAQRFGFSVASSFRLSHRPENRETQPTYNKREGRVEIGGRWGGREEEGLERRGGIGEVRRVGSAYAQMRAPGWRAVKT